MKNKLTLLATLLLLSWGVFAQTPPEKINYQAVARNLTGVPLVNQTISVKYEIRSGSSSGTVVYAETHALTTNQFGLFTAEVGGGTPSIGTMAGIAWGTAPFYLYVEVDGDPMGVTQLLSVPYALFAKESANGPAGAPGKNSLMNITPEPAGANCSAGGNKVESGLDDNNDGTLQALEVDYSYFVCDGVAGPTGSQGPIGLTGPAGTAGPTGANGVGIDSTVHNANGTMTIFYSNATSYTTNDLTGPAGANGTTYFAGNGISLSNDTITNLGDNDSNPSNELITLTNLNGNVIEITENGTLHTVDLTSILGSSYTQGAGISIAGNTISAIDTSATNELQNLSISGDTLYIQNGNSIILPSGIETTTTLVDNLDGTFTYTNEIGGIVTFDAKINDADADPTNEIQDLSVVADILTITNNGSATSIDLSPYKELPTTASTGDVLQWNGSAWVAQNPGSGADNWGSQVVITDGTLTGTGTVADTLRGFDGDYNSLTNQPTIPVNTSDLTNDSGFITSPDDADNDPNNEIELPSTASTGEVLIYNGSAWVAGTSAPDGDGNSTNEIQNLSNGGKVGNNQTINITSGTGTTFSVADGDSSATNEIQTLSLTGDTLSISGGNSVDLSALSGTTYTAGPGINLSGDSITNTAPDQTVVITGGGTTIVTSTYPSFIVTTNDNDTSATNELQNLSVFNSPGSVTLNISGGNNISFNVDDSPTNELITSFGVNGTSDSLVIVEAGNTWNVPLTSFSTTGKWTQVGDSLFPTTLTNKVGIGTTSPKTKLHVMDSRPEVLLETIAGGNFKIGFRYKTPLAEWSIGQGEATGQQFRVSDIQTGTVPFVIEQGSGNVGIGTTTPVSKFEVENTTLMRSAHIKNLNPNNVNTSSLFVENISTGNGDKDGINVDVMTVGGTKNTGVISTVSSGSQYNTAFSGITYPDNSSIQATILEGRIIGGTGNAQTYGISVVNQSSSLGDAYGGYFANSNGVAGTKYGVRTDVTGNAGIGEKYGIFSIVSGSALRNYAGYFSALGGTNNYAAIFDQGNVGIGTTTPSAKLHLEGSLRLNNLGGSAPSFGYVLTSIDGFGNVEWQPLPASPTLYWGPSGADITNLNAGNVLVGGSNMDDAYKVSFGKNASSVEKVLSLTNSNNFVGGGTSLGFRSNFGGTMWDQALISGVTGNASASGDLVFSAMQNRATSTMVEVMRIYGASSNVGIGTAAPTAGRKLEVINNSIIANTTAVYGQSGAASANNIGVQGYALNSTGQNIGVSGIGQGNTGTNYGISGSASGAATTNMGVYGNASGGTTNWAGYFSGGNVYITNNLGIGATTPLFPLHVNTSSQDRAGYFINSTNSNSVAGKFGVYANTSGGGSGDNIGGWFDASGAGTGINYGVSGQALGTAGENRGVYGSATGAATNWAGYFDQGNVYVQNSLGIGSSTPGMIAGATNYLTIASTGPYAAGSIAALELKGNTNAGNSVAAKLDFLNASGTNNTARIEVRTSGSSVGEGRILFYTNGGTLTEKMRIDEDGNVGIGTNTPGTSLEVNGGLTYTPTSVTTTATYAITVGNSSYIRTTTPFGGTTMSSISNGLKVGQHLIIENAGPYLLTLNDGGANFNIAGNALLYTGDIITLIWNGSRWLELSRSDN